MVTAAMVLKDAMKMLKDAKKKSYDQPRQHIQNQRHYFAAKGPSSQSYGFSSSHVRMCSRNKLMEMCLITQEPTEGVPCGQS